MIDGLDHAKIRAEVAPLTDALTNCVTELELLTPDHRYRVMRALNALFPAQQPAVTELRLGDIQYYGGGMTSGTLK